MKANLITIVGDLTDDTLEKFVEDFYEAEARPGPITVLICSNGGSQSAGTAIYSLLRASSKHITTIAIADVCSMALLVFQAGDKRVMSEGASLLLHDGTIELSDRLLNAKSYIDESMRHHLWYNKQVAERSGIDIKVVTQLSREETYFTPVEALERGLTDAIAPYRSFKSATKPKRKKS